MKDRRYAQFRSNIGRARELVGLGEAFADVTVGRVDSSDIYRASLVQAVAAVDSYVHGVVLDYGVEILMGSRPSGSPTRLGLHFGAIRDLVGAESPVELQIRARSYIAERISKETFQKPDDIAQAFAMVGIGKVWTAAFGDRAHEVKTNLSVVVGRRNDIVHSCDVDPVEPDKVRSISSADSIEAIHAAMEAIEGINAVV